MKIRRGVSMKIVLILVLVFGTVLVSTAAADVKMSFVVWSYGLETIQDNIQKFQAQNPGVTIELKDYSWLDYHDTIVGRFAAGNYPELMYGSDHWLQEWASAGWLVPLDKYFPKVKQYSPELAPYALQGMTYANEIYGMSYYADTLDFIYNAKQLAAAGFSTPPRTLDDLFKMASALKTKGIVQYPIILAWSQKEGAFPEAFLSLVFAQQKGGSSMFDAAMKPVFNAPNSAAAQVLNWVRKAYGAGLIDPVSLSTAEIDQIKSMQAGAHAFTIAPQYNMAELNRPNSGDFAGQFKIALMPGTSNATVGYVRFYAMTSAVPKKGKDYLDGAWKFFEYFAGKTSNQYVVVKRWAVENGLGFAQLPLFNDADVRTAFGKWGDIATISQQAKLARAKEGLTPWYGAWDIFMRAEVQRVILGQESSADALSAMASKWEELKAQ
jgi:multiple sugar transport system substrate-binding protein